MSSLDIEAIQETVQTLSKILNDPQPGLYTWTKALLSVAGRLNRQVTNGVTSWDTALDRLAEIAEWDLDRLRNEAGMDPRRDRDTRGEYLAKILERESLAHKYVSLKKLITL